MQTEGSPSPANQISDIPNTTTAQDHEKLKTPRVPTPQFSSASSEDEKDAGIERVPDLARQITNKSIAYSARSNLPNPFLDGQRNSSVDPTSNDFSPREWMKLILAISSRDPERYPTRTSGISFNNLNVYGFGSPTDYQKDVVNVFLEFASVVRWAAGTGKQNIQILRGFDGLVRSGEMLMVLGRPGSGCTTLLKAISSELNGIYVSDKSKLNYQGRSYPFRSCPC